MPCNIKTLSHIALIDLEGRYGLQGYCLSELIIYLRDYLIQAPEVDTNLINILNQMIENIRNIQKLNTHPNEEKVERLAREFQQKISTLELGHSFYLPGGWENRDKHGHGMILSFTRSDNDHLEFKIYNGGAGMQLHDELESLTSVKYMPVKIYQLDLSKATNPDFTEFIKSLIQPQICHAPWRKNEFFSYDEYLLYEEIHLQLNIMQGLILDARKIIDTQLSGSGITSGTCTQASIQQFLKVYFNDMIQYKKFMVFYKIHAIEDYLTEYPAPQSIVAQLINKAIINIQRIIHDNDSYFLKNEQKTLENRLQLLNVLESPIVPTYEKIITLPMPPEVLSIPDIQPKMPVYQENKQISSIPSNPEIEMFQALENFEYFFDPRDYYLMLLDGNRNFIKQGFQKFLDLPFITVAQFQGLERSYFDDYTQNQLLIMIENLSLITQRLYQNFHPIKGSLEEIVFQGTLLTLTDYIAQKLKIQDKTISILLKHVQAHYQKNPQIFSIDPRINSRLNTIMEIYKPQLLDFSKENALTSWDSPSQDIENFIHDAKKCNLPENAWGIQQLYRNFEMLADYRNKLSSHKLLNDLYQSSNSPLSTKIEKFNLQALSVLVNDIIPNISTQLITPGPQYQKKVSLEALLADVQHRAFVSANALYLSEPIERLRKELLDYLCMLETLNKHRDSGRQSYWLYDLNKQDPVVVKLEKVISREATFNTMKWIQKHLKDPEVQKNIQLYMIFICAYLAIKKNRYQAYINSSDLINQINEFLNQYEIYHQNILFLRENQLLNTVQSLLLEKQIDTNITLTFSKSENKSQPPTLILNTDDILQLQLSTLNQNFLESCTRYQVPLLRILPLLQKVNSKINDYSKKNIYKNFYSELSNGSSNQIECSQQSNVIKMLRYIDLANEFKIILLLEYFSQPELLYLLQNDEEYQEYFLLRLFNSYALDSSLEHHPQILIKSLEKICNKSYLLNGQSWNEKNDFLLRIKSHLLCYAYLKNPDIFASNLRKLEIELQTLPVNANRQYCEFLILSSQFLQREPIDLEQFNSININLNKEKFTQKLNEVESALLENQVNNLQHCIRTHHPQHESFIVYSPSYTVFRTIDKYLNNDMLKLFHLNNDTLTIEKENQVIEVLSTPSYFIHMSEGQIQSIEKDGKIWINNDVLTHLPKIFEKDKILIWQDKDHREKIILERNDKAFLKITPNGLYSLEEIPGKLAYGESDIKLSSFEDLSYILSFQYEDGSSLSILERYDIAFKKDTLGQICFLNAPDFHLIDNIYSPFSSEVACLMLVSENHKQLCLVPFHKFYFDFVAPQSISLGQYQPIIHDIHLRLNENDKNNKQSYVIFDIEDGVPKPRNTQDSLYLCYIFMATRQYKKANKLLKKMIKENSFTASSEEMTRWRWIIDDCPVYTTKFKEIDTLNHQYYVNQKSGEELACRLRTIILMGLWYQQGHPIDTQLINKFSHDYFKYQILSRELMPEYILSFQEKRAYFLLNPKTSWSSTTHDKVQSQIFQLQRLKEASDNEDLRKDLDQRIKNLEKVYPLYSTFEVNTTPIQLRGISDKLPQDKIDLITTSNVQLHQRISTNEIKNHFPSLMKYFMGEPSVRDVELLKVLILQSNKKDRDTRYALLLLLYLMYKQKNHFSYDKLDQHSTFNHLWDLFSQIENIKIEIPQGLRTRWKNTTTPLISNQKILEELSPIILKNQKIEILQEFSSLFSNENIEDYLQGCLQLENQWQAILDRANALNSKEKRKAYLTGKFQKLGKKDLLNCYIQENINIYMITCMMTSNEANMLHLAIHQALYHELEKQWLDHYLKLHQNIPVDPVAIAEHRLKKPSQNFAPPLMHLQYNLDILLRPEQVQVIQKAINPESPQYQLISLPMGSGKTKVLLPCLANYFANGQYLSIVEVPVALLQSTYQDFKASTLAHFNKTVYLLTFERWTNVNPDALKRLFEHLENVIIEKNIIMTSPDTIQSLILQYIELMLLDPQRYQEETKYLNQIISIIQNRTIAIMDEAHHTLSPQTMHNFSLGIKQTTPRQHIKFLLDFYRYIHSKDLTKSAEILMTMLSDENSPLMHNIRKQIHPHLQAYFNNNSEACRYIDQFAKADEKELLAFYRLQLISQTKDRDCLFDNIKQLKLFVDYGPSKIQDSALDANIAIPYETNNTPLEHSEFSYHWITLNCTIQMLFHNGIKEDLFKAILEISMRDEALQRKLNVIFLKLSINVKFLTLENKDQVHDIFLNLISDKQLYQSFCYLSLEECLLPRIEVDTKTLSQNSYQLLHSHHRVLAVTGTPGEALYYANDLSVDNQLTKGSHERLIKLLEEKQTPLLRCDDKTPHGLLSLMQENGHIREHFSAIIDINAHFTGINNEDVAHAIVDFLVKQQSNKTHVLFFNIKNELCALSTRPTRNIQVIGGTTPAQIQKVVRDIQAEQYFVYYDQSHFFGVDILLEKNAFALVLTDDEHDFSQGCTRLRGLEKEQYLSFVVPSKTKAYNLQELDLAVKKYQQKKLQQNIIELTINQCKEIIYQNIWRKVQQDSHSFPKATPFLVSEKPMTSLYENYGIPLENINTNDFLINYQTALLRQYAATFGNEDLPHLQEKMEQIIKAVPHEIFPPQYPQKPQPSRNERNTNLSIEQKKSLQIDHAHLKEQEHIHQASIKLNPLPMEISKNSKPLNVWLETDIFSNHLKASQAFMETYEGQSLENLQALKPILMIEFYIIKPEKLEAKLICIEEYQKPQDQNQWYTTISGEILSGDANTKWLESAEFKSLLEQVQFYHGHLSLLEENSEHLKWLSLNTQEKINYYKNHLMRLRQTKEYIVDDLHSMIQTSTKLDLIQTMIKDESLKIHLTEVARHMESGEHWDEWQSKGWADYPLRIILLLSINSYPSPKNQYSIFSIFKTKVMSDKDILDIINNPLPLSTEELNIINQYIHSKDPTFHQFLNFTFPFVKIQDYFQYLNELLSREPVKKNNQNDQMYT